MAPLTVGTQTYANLTVNVHANNLPDYDWYRWTAKSAGTVTATITVTPTQGNLEIHLFTVSGDTLVELAKTNGSNTETVSAAVVAGQIIMVEVKGQATGSGVANRGIGTYVLSIALQ